MSISSIHAALFGLGSDLAGELQTPLRKLCGNVELIHWSPDENDFEKIALSQAQVIFCDAKSGVVSQLRKTNPQAHIVVVSRHPEVTDWLDAIEAGAADYCAAPFETSQVRWILDSSMRAAKLALAA